MIDLAISSSTGGALPEKIRARLQSELHDLLRHDPALASRARRVGIRPDEDGE